MTSKGSPFKIHFRNPTLFSGVHYIMQYEIYLKAFSQKRQVYGFNSEYIYFNLSCIHLILKLA